MFTPRKELSNFLNTQWYQYAVNRCGYEMPNCFTYATGRISEILGTNQPLDDIKVVGAQELWNNYDESFTQSAYAKEGALMIWASGQYGHVAVCEELIDTNTIGWSESNYGGNMFGYLRGNPNGYYGMQFLGYLVHKDLPSAEQATQEPQAESGSVLNELPSDFVSESATFTCNVDAVNIRRAPSLNGALTGDWYENGMSFHYDGYVKREGYVWCSYISNSGERRWVAVREIETDRPYGTFA